MAKIESNLNKLNALDERLQLLRTPTPPYYAVISTNIMKNQPTTDYDTLMESILETAINLPGFLGAEVAYDQTEDGRRFKLGVTYWDSMESIDNWRNHSTHMQVKKQGKALWYDEHNARICHVLSHYGSNLTQKKSSELAYQEP